MLSLLCALNIFYLENANAIPLLINDNEYLLAPFPKRKLFEQA